MLQAGYFKLKLHTRRDQCCFSVFLFEYFLWSVYRQAAHGSNLLNLEKGGGITLSYFSMN